MTVTVSKPALNIREELSALKKPSGLVGEQLLRSNTIDDAYSVLGNNKNFIINGDFKVWQRGTSFAYNTLGGAPFTADRFWFYNGGGSSSGTVERSTDVPAGQPFTYSMFNNTNGNMPSGTNVELTRVGSPAPFVVGETYTLSFWVKGTSAGNGVFRLTWRPAHADGANEVVIRNGIQWDWGTTWKRVTYTFPIISTPHAANTTLDFEYAHPAGAKMTGFQLERGAVATPFEVRPIVTELAMCQRYFQKLTAQAVGFQPEGNNGQNGRQIWAFPVTMRAAPSASNISVTYRQSASTYTASSVSCTTTIDGLSEFFATASTLPGYDSPTCLLYSTLYLSAEL
jgi:hypothetical protein